MQTNGVRLHVVDAGPPDGPLVVLLHGFPEFWYGWRHQIGGLASAGYRVWAPDQRGYNTSDKPAGAASYGVELLAADVVGLIDAAGREKVFVCGHDWGGVVAWRLAAVHPDRVERLVVINAPHGAVFGRHLRRNAAQMRRSWYVFFFQLSAVPEALLRLGDGHLLARALTRSSRPGTFGDEELARYREAWRQPGALAGMLGWYRAAFRGRPRARADARIRVPTLLLWGARDGFLGRELAQPSIERCEDGRLVTIDDATHWVQHEEPERVNTLLKEFFV